MPRSAVPACTWVRFTGDAALEPTPGTTIDRLRVESVTSVSGDPLAGIAPGRRFARLQSTLGVPAGEGELVGVTRELGYLRAAERAELAATAIPGPEASVVVIALSKSAAWWELAHDERDALLRGAGTAEGHVNVGRPSARRIVRTLYHGRGLPGAGWDFLTYFEFSPELGDEFRALVGGLRDTRRNPEWQYVEREAEIWLSKLG